MPGFGIGGGGSRTISSSRSYGSDLSSSTSGGVSSAGSQDSVAFEDIFARMFGGAEGAAGGLDPSMLTGAANEMFSSGTGFMDSLSGGAASDYMENRLSGDNEVLQQQIDLLGEDLGNFFSEQINPEITAQAIGGGQLGGGRQGVAQGMAAGEVGDQFRRGATALRAGDINARDAVAGTLGQQGIQSAATGFQGMGSILGAADMGFSAGMAPYERLAAILGGPTTLNQSFSNARDFAESSRWATNHSEAQSTSRSHNMMFQMSGTGE